MAVFLYLCSSTLIATLEMQEEVDATYDLEKERAMGWSILNRDIANTVGIYYHHRSLWAPPEQGGKKKEDAASKKKKKDKKKEGHQ